jgi:hypothetical protein
MLSSFFIERLDEILSFPFLVGWRNYHWGECGSDVKVILSRLIDVEDADSMDGFQLD